MALRPFYEDVQAHYDLSNEFYELFLDASMTYSCAYFEPKGITLEQAQQAKLKLSLDKCQLSPGDVLLDIGCGWGAAARYAAKHYGVRVIGLTLSQKQFEYAKKITDNNFGVEFRLQGWEEFDEPVDRIVSIGAFEHFRIERYPAFFSHCYRLLPPGGRMLLHTIVHGDESSRLPGLPELDEDFIRYMKFISKHIFPGGQVPPRGLVIQQAELAGFRVERVHPLSRNYQTTLECWAERLEANRDAAKSLTDAEVVERYLRYMRESAEHFRTGRVDVAQFTLVKGVDSPV